MYESMLEVFLHLWSKAMLIIKITPDLNQPQFQFSNAIDVCTVNTFVNGRSYLIVNWVNIDVWMPGDQKFQRNKV